jgi:hypothetical protein
LDEPLPGPVQESVEAEFQKAYEWDLEAERRGCDSLLGRCKRESDKLAYTMFPIRRVRSIAQLTRRSDQKKQRVGDIEISVGYSGAADEPDVSRYRQVMLLYGVLANTWAMAGISKVNYRGKPVRKCHWQQSLKYVGVLRDETEHLLDNYTEDSVIDYAITVEEAFRASAIELSRRRTDAVPWGCALIEATLRDSLWGKHASRLCKLSGGSQPSKDRGATRQDVPPPVAGALPKAESGKPASYATCTHDAHGTKICKARNDSRKCESRCPKGEAHVCDAQIASTGKACGAKDHTRVNHDAKKHGAVAKRP